ncbi:MAG: PDZ domain-containing protein, partial [Xanthomonadales bacterium]|nr:PDZ domain-containing protein [Xanthomonadales bacterium]
SSQIKSIITWVLLALLVWVWVQFILFPKHQNNDIKAVTAPPSNLPTQVVRPKPSSYHLFGSSTETEIPLSLLQGETSLELIITGILASDDPTSGMAFIRNRQGEEKKFKVGDDVFGLATLDAIHEDYLILRRGGGKREKLSLSKKCLSTINQTSSLQTTDDTQKIISSNRIANHIKKPQDWQQMMNAQKFDPNKIAQMASKVSVVRDGQGQITGLRVSQMAGANSLTKQGLRSNDQIIAVNGVKIAMNNILELRKQLESGSSADVTVLRNGKQLNLNLNLSELQ